MAYDPTQRPRYFEGQYLEDTDFSDEQAYHRDRQQLHHRLLHVSGIAEGLDWKEASTINQAISIEAVRFSVSAGTAFDIQGRSIVLLSDSPVTPITVTPDPQGEWILFIQYREEATDPQGDKGTETRTSETPRIDFAKVTLEVFNQQVLNTSHDLYAAIALAKFTVTNQKISTNLDFSVRQYAGLRLPAPGTLTAPTLRSSNSGNLPLAILNGGLSVVGQGEKKVDFTVNGRLRSDNNDGGLWVKSDRFVGGHSTNKIGFFAGEAWRLTVQSDGKTGIGTMLPSSLLSVAGGVTVGSTYITETTSAADGQLIVQNKIGIGTKTPGAALAINGGLHVGGDLDPGNDNLEVDGSTKLSGALNVTGNSHLIGTLTVGSTLSVAGSSNFTGALTANNSVSLLGTASHLSVGGNTTIAGTLAVSGTNNFTGALTLGSTLNVTGNSILSGSLTVNNSVFLKGAANTTGLTVANNGKVGIGTLIPTSMLSVVGGGAIGIDYATGSNIALDGQLIVQNKVGIGTPTPRTALDTWTGALSGAANDYPKAQWAMSGGGKVTWNNSRLKWTHRFLVVATGSKVSFSDGALEIYQPTTNIPAEQVYNNQPRSVDEDGISLSAYEALYAVHTIGGGQRAFNFWITAYHSSFNTPSNWLLVAVVNGDDNTIKLGTGVMLSLRSSSSQGSPLPTGMILMWHGEINAIPHGWALCNGNNGTPDLSNKFVVGVGSDYAVGNTGGGNTVKLEIAQIPLHSHGIPVDTGSGGNFGYRQSMIKTSQTVGGDTNFVTPTDLSGGNEAHENRPPYYALCFIMKL